MKAFPVWDTPKYSYLSPHSLVYGVPRERTPFRVKQKTTYGHNYGTKAWGPLLSLSVLEFHNQCPNGEYL